MGKKNGCLGLLFSVFLILGVIVAKMISDGMDTPPTLPTPTPTAVSPAPKSQIPVFLVIGVNQFSSNQTYLESAWLISITPEMADGLNKLNIILVGIYPVTPEMVSNPDLGYLANTHAPIPIDLQNIDSLSSMALFTGYETSWDEVIVLDEYAMNGIIHLGDRNAAHQIPTPSPNLFTKPWDSPAASFEMQSGILENLCNNPHAYLQFQTLQDILSLYPNHLQSTMEASKLSNLWQVYTNGDKTVIYCDPYPKP